MIHLRKQNSKKKKIIKNPQRPTFSPLWRKKLSCSLTCDHFSGKCVISVSLFDRRARKAKAMKASRLPAICGHLCLTLFITIRCLCKDSLIYVITGSCLHWACSAGRIPDEWVHAGYVWAGIPSISMEMVLCRWAQVKVCNRSTLARVHPFMCESDWAEDVNVANMWSLCPVQGQHGGPRDQQLVWPLGWHAVRAPRQFL